MDNEHLEAARTLIDFARANASDVYTGFDDDEQDASGQTNMEHLLEQADVLEGYLDR